MIAGTGLIIPHTISLSQDAGHGEGATMSQRADGLYSQ